MPNGNGDRSESAPVEAVAQEAPPLRGTSDRVVYVETAPLERQPEDAPAFPP